MNLSICQCSLYDRAQSSTDRNRILTVVSVLDGVSKQLDIERRFLDIDEGKTEHFHGPLSHAHTSEHDNIPTDHDHGKKLHLVFQDQYQGVAESRRVGVEFVQLLNKQYVESGLKDEEEDIILLFLRSDATLEDNQWLGPITAALIVPPSDGEKQQKNVANAVSLAMDYSDAGGKVVRSVAGSIVGFRQDLQFEWRKTSEKNADVLDSYPTPVVLGAATAMRLDVFASLPARDSALQSQFAADMELSLNMWLCADGIDVIPAA